MKTFKGAFITGTDTEVGKTYFTSLWTRQLRKEGVPALALKPYVCGERTDAEILTKANEETLSLNEINPVHLLPPLAPYMACVLEERPLDWQLVQDTIEVVTSKHKGPFLVEGVGGWNVPLTKDYWVSHWAKELNLPVVVVVRADLGTINHTLLTVEAIKKTGLPVLGIVINFHGQPSNIATQTNPAAIEDLTGLPLFQLDDKATELSLPRWLKFDHSDS